MTLNPERLKTAIKNVFDDHDLELDDCTVDEDSCHATIDLTLKKCKGSIYTSIYAFDNGELSIKCIFDHFDLDADYKLLNEFNNSGHGLYAYVNDKGYLVVQSYTFKIESEEAVGRFIEFFLNYLVQDNVYDDLAVLSDHTM